MKGDVIYKYDELINNFDKIEYISTLQCSGNRGDNFRKICNLSKGNLCMNGFISNAKWKGILLKDILFHATNNNLDQIIKDNGYKYVTFYGYDTDISMMHYTNYFCLI